MAPIESNPARSAAENPADNAVATAKAFVSAFSAQDHERLAATLNYPHVRLAGGRFFTFDDAESFIERSRQGKQRLIEENFGYSVLREIEPFQVGPDKVHLRIINDRHHPDGPPLNGEVYLTFNTMWIATLQDDHWGIQFRSSYLATGVTAAETR